MYATRAKHSRTLHIYWRGLQRSLKEHTCMLPGRMGTCACVRDDGADDGGNKPGVPWWYQRRRRLRWCGRGCCHFPAYFLVIVRFLPAPAPGSLPSLPPSPPFPARRRARFLSFLSLPIPFIILLIFMLLLWPLWFLPSTCGQISCCCMALRYPVCCDVVSVFAAAVVVAS